MKTLQTAFEDGGLPPPRPRGPQLRHLMRAAVLEADGHGPRSIDHFVSALHDHDEVVPLLWELFAAVRGGVLQELFRSVSDELRSEGVKLRAGGGEARVAKPRGRRLDAKSSSTRGHRETWRERTARHQAYWEGHLADDINGTPLGECTAGQVRTYVRSLDSLVSHYQRYVRFLLMVVKSVPDDSLKISDFHDVKSVDHLYEMAAAADPKEQDHAE